MICSTRLGTSMSRATAAVWLRVSAAYASPDRANSAVKMTVPAVRLTSSLVEGMSRPNPIRPPRAIRMQPSAAARR